MAITKAEVCEGCTFYKWNERVVCRTPLIIGIDYCPCLTCLVKSMCSDTCNRFFAYKDTEDRNVYGKWEC